MILLPRYRRSQPVGPVEIDRGNPITRGLATVYLPTVRYPGVDLITRVFDTATTRGVLLPSTSGVAYSTTTSSNWSIRFAPVGIPGSYPALSVFTLFEQYDTTSTGPIFGGGNNSTQYARFSKNNDGSIAFGPNSNSGGAGITGPALNANQVYALAAVNEGNLRELFYDGVSVASSSTAITFLNGTYGFAGSEFPAAGNQRRVGIYCGYVWTRRLTVSEIRSLTENPWQIFQPQRLFVPVQAGAAALDLTANAGAYALTGQTASLYYNRDLSPIAGAYAVTGQSANLFYNRDLSLNAGAYAISGQSADLNYARILISNAGAYSLTGQSADLTKTVFLSANAGSYSISGQTATLTYEQQRVLEANAGSYAVNGQTASLVRTHILSATSGAYSISGQTAALSILKELSLGAGAYSIAGQSADLSYTRSLSASFGAYNISGQAADLQATRLLFAGAGNYAITGQDAFLTQDRSLSAEAGAYAINGQPATLTTIVLYPNPADVREGVVYGPGGIYTGTLVVRNAIYLFDD